MQVILLLKFLDALKQMKESEKANLTFFEHLEIKAEPTRALKILICHGLASGYTPEVRRGDSASKLPFSFTSLTRHFSVFVDFVV